MIADPSVLRLCLVTDRDLAGDRCMLDIVAGAVRGGVTLVQLRDKAASTRGLVADAEALLGLLRPLGIPLLINDRVDVALAVGADGVHVGQDDMPVSHARRLLGPGAIVGLSIPHADDLSRDHEEADYLGVGPVFAQATKTDASPPLGLVGLSSIVRAARKPVMAIGGIAPGNTADVMACGVAGVAVVSALMASEDPEGAARRLASLAGL